MANEYVSTGVFNNQKGKVDNNNKLCKIIIKLIRSRINIENIVIRYIYYIHDSCSIY